MIIDCISDLHGFYPDLEGGDVLIVSGDLTANDKPIQYDQFAAWIDRQKYTKKVLIAGNHDNFFKNKKFEEVQDSYKHINVDYLCESKTEFEGLKIWGSPWTPRFFGMNPKCMAFTYFDESWFYDEVLMNIPLDTDILITHGPAYGILDKTNKGASVGSKSLQTWLKYVARPMLHVFGHIHESYGTEKVFPRYNNKMMISVNASVVNERYEHVNKPIRIIL